MRKRIDDQMQHGEKVIVRLSPREYDELQERARNAGLSMPQFSRLVLRHAVGLPGFYTECQLAREVGEAAE